MIYDMIWHDVIYDMMYDMMWYDMTWYDMIYDIWYDMIWCDMIYDMNPTGTGYDADFVLTVVKYTAYSDITHSYSTQMQFWEN